MWTDKRNLIQILIILLITLSMIRGIGYNLYGTIAFILLFIIFVATNFRFKKYKVMK